MFAIIITAMIDSLGGADRVNNVLAALNLKPISQKNLKLMERRAGNFVESVAKKSTAKAAKDSFELEMEYENNISICSLTSIFFVNSI